MKKDVLIISNSLRSTVNFRMWMVDRMIKEGMRVVIAAPFEGLHPVDTCSIRYVNYSMNRKSVSLLDNLKLALIYLRLLRLGRFDMAICYTVKPALFIPVLFSFSKVKVFSVFTGLGSGFLKAKNSIFFRRLVRFLLIFSKSIVVLNSDDKNFFIKKVGVKSDKISVLPGEGVDMNYYRYSSPVQGNSLDFLFIGRLIKDKGVNELLASFKKVFDTSDKRFTLTIIGDIDRGNPSSLTLSDVSSFSSMEYIRYISETDSIEKYMAQSDVFILPSYREGLSRAALEACSTGRACVFSAVPGLSELVDHGHNGFLVTPGSVESLASSVIDILNRDYKTVVLMGIRSRDRVKSVYDLDSVYESFQSIMIDNEV